MIDITTRNYCRVEAIRRRAIAKRQARARGKEALRAQMAALNSAAQYYDPGYQQRLNPYRGPLSALTGDLFP